ncbi:Lar family restriction alleviation protein [Sphingomonas baiyangensis]|uniref:Restriction alleviation protein Lar n=1 Tax=Sphingomonas baiyangensis TaxID=2572576 RepID=A0A4U1L0Q1_9SPHN|nr:Lar family restriction alleviation protein [Sphingomonas baiyangensis]TKD50182.1 hypothetical protein FBR43_05005 [Sphingomonas baiyangensis]
MQDRSDDLLPCPFCGGEAKLVSGTSSMVQCLNDQCIIGDPAPFNDFTHRSDAITAWNTRAAPPVEQPRASTPAVGRDARWQSRDGCAGSMSKARAAYFLDRFKREEKLLGPNEQWAIDYIMAILALHPPAVGEVERPSDDDLDPHLPDTIWAAKRCGIQRGILDGWFVPWSPRNDNQFAEGSWSAWLNLAREILAADEKARTALSTEQVSHD